MVIFFYCLRPLSRLFKRVHSSHVAAIIAFRVINQLSFAASEETQRLPFVLFFLRVVSADPFIIYARSLCRVDLNVSCMKEACLTIFFYPFPLSLL